MRSKTDTKANGQTYDKTGQETGYNKEPFPGHATYSSFCKCGF